MTGLRVISHAALRGAQEIVLAAVCGIATATGAMATTADFDALETFSALPPIGGINLSPDGTKAVVLQPVDDTYHVAALDLKTGSSKLLMAADPDEFLFNWCRFANDKRIVCSIRSYITPQSGLGGFYKARRIVATRLLAINTDGTNQVQLIKQQRNRLGGKLKWVGFQQDQIVSWLPDEPNHILIALPREDRSFPTVYRLNIESNRLKKVQSFRNGIFAWGADRNGRIIHGIGTTKTDKSRIVYMDEGAATELDVSHLAGEIAPTLLGYSESGDTAYVLANAGNNTRSVVEINSRTAKIEAMLPRSDTHDAVGLLRASGSGRLLASYEVTDRLRYRWLDKDIAKLYQDVQSTLPNSPTNIKITSTDAAANRVVLYAWGGNSVPAYFLFDRKKNALMRLAADYSSLSAEQINPYRGVSYPARDDLNIPAYLTLPADRKAEKLPTVIIPHGGPYFRDQGRFDYWAQFLASLGYAVLQPNYRGSTGYGDDYLAKGFKQWGLAMQDDLDDGLAWMIKQGYTDPDRVCMLGGSYGGYAALVASFRSADKYQCAISFAGVTDLDALVENWWSAYRAYSSARTVQSGELRDQSSPLDRAGDIDVPVLIIHGDVDDRVPINHSRELVAVLEKRKSPHTYIELPNGDHYLSLQSHRKTFLQAVQKFLAANIGAKSSATAAGAE